MVGRRSCSNSLSGIGTHWKLAVQALEAFQKLMEANGNYIGEEDVLMDNEWLRRFWETES